jgi:hypothetical protein
MLGLQGLREVVGMRIIQWWRIRRRRKMVGEFIAFEARVFPFSSAAKFCARMEKGLFGDNLAWKESEEVRVSPDEWERVRKLIKG